MNLIQPFLNLKVGRKLLLGFSIVLFVTIAVLTSGMFGLNNIQDKVTKNELSTDLFNSLSSVRLGRTNFQYTLDQKYLDQINTSARRMQDTINQLNTFTWSVEGKSALDKTASAVNDYVETLNLFTKALNTKKLSEKNWIRRNSTTIPRWQIKPVKTVHSLKARHCSPSKWLS
jgi:methyl-accepting chemotaxis protein-2 (aspartate sensor receptor)